MPPAAPTFDATETVWIWDPARARIVWATDSAVAFWGERSLADLKARPFLPADPNAEAMNALLEAKPPPSDEASPEDREATLTFFPDGAPARMLCRGRLRERRREEGGLWLAIHATAVPVDEPAPGTREGALIETAETAFALIDSAGAPLLMNPAARRLFGLEGAGAAPESLFARHAEPSRARRAAAAAMIRGAFAHNADLLGANGGPRRALIVYRRIEDPETAETLLSLEASPRPGRVEWEAAATDAAAAPEGGRIGLVLLDGRTLRLREANRAAAAMLGRRAHRGAPLGDLFPEKTVALEDAVEAARAGRRAEPIDLPIEAEAGRGPWAEARLTLAPGAGPAAFLLTLLDLGAERRRMLLDEQRRRAGRRALAGLGVGLVFVDPGGRIRQADAAAAEGLGVGDRLAEALADGLALPPLLAPPWDQRLMDRLHAAFAEEPENAGAGAAEPAIETVLTDAVGAAKLARLSISGRLAFGRRLVCVALDFSPRPPAPQEIADLARAQPRRAEAPPAVPRAAQAASHAFRTALTTIKGFAELARDDAAFPVASRQRRRLNDIVETAAALTKLVDRTFEQPAARDAPQAAAQEPADLAEIAAAAAARSAARHPVWRPSAPEPVPAALGREDLDEALDLLLAEAADRGPTRLTAERGVVAGAVAAVIEIETAAAAPDFWPPATLRAAELLVERAGGRLEKAGGDPSAAIARLRVVFPAAL